MSSLLEIRQLSKSYGDRTVVDGLSFSLDAGEVFGLLGPNGAGKSTTMMMICGALASDGGDVLVNGNPLQSDDPASRQHLGVVPQDLAIYPELSATENLRFFGQLYGLQGATLAQRVAEGLERVGLTERASEPVEAFSGGMKRRLNFAAAILHHPRLLILDEPTVGVDPQSRVHLLDCVRSLQATGAAVIYASHYMEEVEAICSRAAIIDHGRMLACDTIEALLKQIPQEVELQLSSAVTANQVTLPATAMLDSNGAGSVIRIVGSAMPSVAGMQEIVTGLLNQLSDDGITVTSIRTHEPNLERLFLKLTGHRLRD
jgi:linearmycin/streptolysin S transport system ATP-binding protein